MVPSVFRLITLSYFSRVTPTAFSKSKLLGFAVTGLFTRRIPFLSPTKAVKKQTLDDLNGQYALCYTSHASFGAHHENLKEHRPIQSLAKM